MTNSKNQINDAIIFVHGNIVAKGLIDEVIIHHTQKKIIVKYIVRPYGLKDFITIDEDKIYDDIEVAKKYVINGIRINYKKENIIKNYEENLKKIKETYEKQLNDFDDNFIQAIKGVEEITEEYYDNLENEYQKLLSKESDKEIKNND